MFPAVCGGPAHHTYTDTLALPIEDGQWIRAVATPAMSPCTECHEPGGLVDGAYVIRDGRAVSVASLPTGYAGGGTFLFP